MQANGGGDGGATLSADPTSPSMNPGNSDQLVNDMSSNARMMQHHHHQASPISQGPNKNVLLNQAQTSQQPKPSNSPGHHQSSTTTASIGSMSNNSTSGGGAQSTNNLTGQNQDLDSVNAHFHNTGSMYPRQQRYGQYHGQHHTPHHHHHHHPHHQNKYNNPKSDNESIVNHVILITVINPHYPITCDLIHQICSTYGKVNRIVIFKKNGVQAMVEFDNTESAKRARSMLQGCDIYSGCCTLRVEFAKPVRLNVHKNDSESFDYTNPNLGSGGMQPNSETENNGQQHNLQLSSASHSSTYLHSSASHHGRGSGAGRRAGGDVTGIGGNSSINNVSSGHQHSGQFHQSQHIHSDHQILKQQPIPPTSSSQHGPQPTAYIMGQPLDVSNAGSSEPVDSFHQDGNFGAPRAGSTSSPSHQHNYVNVEPFMTAIHNSSHGIYPRHDGGHHHSQHHQPHHHHRGHGGSGSGHNHHGSPFPPLNTTNPLMAGPSNLTPQGTVMMIYGLSTERVNCDRLFNLFCLYGNVVRVKFLRSKEGCAMVQMGDVIAVDRCVSSLNKITLFENEIQISYSKQAFLHDVIQPFTLPDGSPSFKDFMGNKNNRFKNPEVASKNRILPPSRVLHFFNAPYGISEDELINLFKQTTGHEPVSVKIFTPKTENAKSFSGLVTFRDPVEATEALVLCNHISMPKAGAPHPYILRLCFSPPTYC